MTTTVAAILGDLQQYKFDPASLARRNMSILRAVRNGEIEIVDATNPVVWVSEVGAIQTSMAIEETAAAVRQLYPKAALRDEELYLHMSDKEFVNRFAVPTTAEITLLFNQAELLSLLVLDEDSGYRKLRLPRNTTVTVSDVTFSLQYPVEIRQLPHGGLQVVYLADQASPLQTLDTNVIGFETVTDPQGRAFLKLTLLMTQFKIETQYLTVSSVGGFKKDIALTDQFYHARVWRQVDGVWEEILTTHTQQVYDPATPTVLLQLLGTTLRVSVPLVYANSGALRGKLRIDVYQTKGPLTMALAEYASSDYAVHWYAIDAADNDRFVQPLTKLKTFLAASTSRVHGGRAALSFEQLRERVIANVTGAPQIPITNVQLSTLLSDLGFELVRNVDQLTNRIFWASRPMPPSVDERILTAAAATMGTLRTTLAAASDAPGVRVNGASLTLTPQALYWSDNGVLKLVSHAQYDALQNNPDLNARAAAISAQRYYYSPFYYVCDAREGFAARAYRLDAPQVVSRSFVMENASSGYQAAIGAEYAVQLTPQGYRLLFVTSSSQEFRALDDSLIEVQLAFRSADEDNWAYQSATQIGTTDAGERIFEVLLASTLDVDARHALQLSSTRTDTGYRYSRVQLLQEFEVFFTVHDSAPAQWRPNAMDAALGRFALNGAARAVAHERLRVRFGHALTTLWTRSRSALGGIPYQTYPTDVPLLYEDDVFELDPDGAVRITVGEDDQLQFHKLHAKGDPVLDAQGQPKFKHRAGDPILDASGAPVPQAGHELDLVRLIDLMLIDGVYAFATDEVAVNYRQALTETVTTWLTQTLVGANQKLLEQTHLYYYPKVNQGDVKVLTDAGVEATMVAEQSFTVRLAVPKLTFDNPTLRAQITRNTIKQLDAALKAQVVALSAVESQLRALYGEDVRDVRVSGLGGDAQYHAVTLLDAAQRLSLKKNLTVLANGKFAVSEDVNVQYVLMEV